MDASPEAPPSLPPRSSAKKWVVAAALLLAEYLALSFVFDAQTVGSRGGVWSILGQAGNVGPLLVVGATAFLLLPRRAPQAQPEPVGAPRDAGRTRTQWGLLGLHVVVLASFFLVTHIAFGRPEPPPGPGVAWLLVFAILALATASTLFVGVVGNWSWIWTSLRRALLAGGLLGLGGWLAGTLSTELWRPLSRATFITVASLLDALGFELYADFENLILELEGFSITVAPICSGFEGIGLFVALMGAYLYRVRRTLRLPGALLLLPLGMGAVWFGNALRIAALMVVGARISPQIAVGSFHSKAGWVFFCAMTLGVAALSRTAFFSKAPISDATLTDDKQARPPGDASPLLIPLLTWIGLGLLSGSFSDGHDPLYAVRVGVTGAVLWSFRKDYEGLWRRPNLLALGIGGLVGVVWLVVPYTLFSVEASPELPTTWSRGFRQFWVITRALGATIVVPIVEELAFRGFLARWLTRRKYEEVSYSEMNTLGIVGSSIIFGIVHGQWALGIATGIIYALLLRRSGRLFDAITAHAASNAVIAIWVLVSGHHQHW